jgi:hypothetical protein
MARAWRASRPKLLKFAQIQSVEDALLAYTGSHTCLEGRIEVEGE